MALTKTAATFTEPTAASGLKTFTAKGLAVNNAVFALTFINSTTVNFTGFTGTGITWTQVGAGQSATITGGGNYAQIWQGVVTSVQATAQTMTGTTSASNTSLYTGIYVIGEWTNSDTTTTWSTVTSASRAAATAASVTYSSLTGNSGDLYIGNGAVGSGGAAGTTGSPAGFTFGNSSSGGQPWTYSVLSSTGATGTITQTKSASSITAAYSVIVRATGAAVVNTSNFFPFLTQ